MVFVNQSRGQQHKEPEDPPALAVSQTRVPVSRASVSRDTGTLEHLTRKHRNTLLTFWHMGVHKFIVPACHESEHQPEHGHGEPTGKARRQASVGDLV